MPVYESHETSVGDAQSARAKFRVPVHMQLVKKVGSGAYGCVASFKDTRNEEKLAVKKITSAFDDLIDGKRILREVKLLRQLHHGNIIQILDMYPPASPDFQDIYIVTELMESDLNRVIYSKQPLSEEHHIYFVHQMLRGLVYLHSAQVVHRDIKPSNMLVNKDCSLKICDFGLARVLQNLEKYNTETTDYVVTRWYRAPEVVLAASEYTFAIDMWAIGCILAELITRKALFNGLHHFDQIKKIVTLLGFPAEDDMTWMSQDARSFLERCPHNPPVSWDTVLPDASESALEVVAALLRFNPSKRANVQDALRLKYFEAHFEEEDLEYDTRESPVDWSFDDFEPTKRLLQNFIYCECASFHPEIMERDRASGLLDERPDLVKTLAERLPPELVLDSGVGRAL
eukprot:TRINITY_DN76707_c0_g1_i1.p1 TRINITY_DN76707_c0_g1~~TRINITY_DN76707_c0_g1_i1.p1  ORF type:complete len:401 (+),score=78.43 TRINITY_DN76707_c0_g1_i1:115-1317(+)